MKRIITAILSVLTAMVFNACTDEQESITENENLENDKIVLSQEELASISFDNPIEIQEKDVLSIVANFINMRNESSGTRSTSDPKMIVRTKSYLGEKNNTEATRNVSKATIESIPVYEVMIENGDKMSYAVVSADKRDPNVLVFFDSFPTDEYKIKESMKHPNTRAIISLAEKQLIENIEKVEQLKTTLRDKTIGKICSALNISVSEYSFESIVDKLGVTSEILTRNHIGVQEPLGTIIAKKEPMCGIIWEERPPYNGECPVAKILIPYNDSHFVVDSNVPAGCVTIACIHAEACVERATIGGIPMDWGYYKTAKALDTKLTPILQMERARKAIRYIYDELKCYSVYAYYNGQRYVNASASNQGETYIMNHFNYEKNQKFDPDVILSSLNANKPIYVSGVIYGNDELNPDNYSWEGHAFVIDGYIITSKLPALRLTKATSDIVKDYDLYWHINLGWGDNSNAYFRLDSDETCTPQFFDKYDRFNIVPTKDMNIISHLSKK